MNRFLFEDLERRAHALISVAIAAGYFFLVFGPGFITAEKHWSLGHGDRAQHLIGYLYFAQDEWRLPLLDVPNLGYPNGTNIILTDSLPLLALPFKLFAPILPDGVHPFGLWIFICVVLAAHGFGALLYHFGHRGILSSLAGSIFAVTAPFLTFRIFGHASLCGQFLILYGMLLYFRAADASGDRSYFPRFGTLLTAAWLTHAYLFAMVAVMFACSLVTMRVHSAISFMRLTAGAAGVLTVLALTGLVSGSFSLGIPWMPDSSFGHYSMNVLSPITPEQDRPILPNYPDPTGGQYEGMNYWGAGTMLLLLASVLSWTGSIRILISSRLWPLLTGLLALTIFALSGDIYFADRLLLSYELPWPVSYLQFFRSSGRFFWPVSYAVMIFAVSKVLSMKPRRAAVALLVGSAVLQWLDTAETRQRLRQAVRAGEEQLISAQLWRPIISAHDAVALVPAVQCGARRDLYSEIGKIAATSGVRSHSYDTARHNAYAPESCRALFRELLDGDLRPGVLYVLDQPTTKSVKVRLRLTGFCGMLEGHAVCSLDRSRFDLDPLLEPGPAPLQEAVLGASQLRNVLGAGWAPPEEAGIWSLGDQSELFLPVDSCDAVRSLRLRIMPFPGLAGRTVSVSANGEMAVTEEYTERTTYELTVPVGPCEGAGQSMIAVTIRVGNPGAPIEIGESYDHRPLGVFLTEVEIVTG